MEPAEYTRHSHSEGESGMDERMLSSKQAASTVRSADGTMIAVERSGEGPPLILVGGALSNRAAAAPLAALLPEFSVYAYDRRGRGDSSDHTILATDSAAREIEALDAVIAAAGGDAFVYGMSPGAVLALEAALHGSAITRLALYEPPYSDAAGSPYEDNPAARYADLIAAGRPGDVVESFLTDAVRMPAEAVRQMRAGPGWPGLEQLAPTLIYDMNVLGDGRVPVGRLAGLHVPTLVLTGGQSPPWLQEPAAAVAAALPDSTCRILPEQTHAVNPEVLAPILRAFFASAVS
jgi:pimeloyl-ACP methyl ester carboxylesterase